MRPSVVGRRISTSGAAALPISKTCSLPVPHLLRCIAKAPRIVRSRRKARHDSHSVRRRRNVRRGRAFNDFSRRRTIAREHRTALGRGRRPHSVLKGLRRLRPRLRRLRDPLRSTHRGGEEGALANAPDVSGLRRRMSGGVGPRRRRCSVQPIDRGRLCGGLRALRRVLRAIPE